MTTTSYQPSSINKLLMKWLAEHRQLIAFKQELLNACSPILQGQSNYNLALLSLYRKVQEFSKLWTNHVKEEEQTLMPVLANLLGEERGMLAVLNCEHEQIAFHLKAFLSCARPRETVIPLPAAKSLVFHILEIDKRLNSHIKKEESIIFPILQDHQRDSLLE
ncbi:hemerythrin domain-containing protein [Ectobacillus polymachus]|uniref:hemerythrin domain-containing protein n=1 Tax=Ectobacillus polymachus TaxID=1508806 RepID=UPI003A874E7C